MTVRELILLLRSYDESLEVYARTGFGYWNNEFSSQMPEPLSESSVYQVCKSEYVDELEDTDEDFSDDEILIIG